jgi:CheY-like chemotaxis protein
MSSALKNAFGQTDVATNLQAALALAAKKTYDVIFLDADLPGMDGLGLCSNIQQTGPNGAIPIVFVASHRGFESRARAGGVEDYDFVAKPFSPFELAVKALTLAFRSRFQPAGAVYSAATEECAASSLAD